MRFRTGVTSSSSRAERPGEARQRPMRLGAGTAPLHSRPIGLATLALLGICALGFASSVALAGQASPQQVTTGETTTSPSTAATTTSPAPDPKPPPPPKPDPKPKRTRVTPPPPPPPAPSPQPAVPQSTTPTAVTPSPPPAPPPAAPPTRETTTRVAPPVTRPSRRTRLRSTKRAKAASRERSQFSADAETEEALDGTAAPAAELSQTDSPPSGVLVVFGPLFALGLLLVTASAVSPARVPWPVLSKPLYLHRTDLAVIGIGTIALALLCLNIAVLL